MKKIILLVGPPGCGKSTQAGFYESMGYIRVSQDDQGKEGHLEVFKDALNKEQSIVVDRMNFSVEQRKRYIPPVESGYIVECVVLHQNRETCLERMQLRPKHPTITNMQQAGSALHTFFKNYQKPTKEEGFHEVSFLYPEVFGNCIIVDIDGTIADLSHRLHFIKTEGKKKDWKSFLSNCEHDEPKEDVIRLIQSVKNGYHNHSVNVVLCSGRGDEYRDKTQNWLQMHFNRYNHLFMRERADYREDYIIKEIILDFEIMTRYNNIIVAFDDRDQVVKMWRSRDILCMQVASGDF